MDFTIKLENLKLVADMVGKQVSLLVCVSVFNLLFRGNVLIVGGRGRCQLVKGRLVCLCAHCVVSV